MKPFTVLVPCSTSNLGAGFDAVGIALSGPDLMVRVTPGGEGLRIARLSGEGADRLPPDSTNRVIDAAYRAAAAAGRSRQALAAELSIHSSIPLKRGLGSSAAAALAGGLLADALLGGAIGQEVLLRTAAARRSRSATRTARSSPVLSPLALPCAQRSTFPIRSWPRPRRAPCCPRRSPWRMRCTTSDARLCSWRRSVQAGWSYWRKRWTIACTSLPALGSFLGCRRCSPRPARVERSGLRCLGRGPRCARSAARARPARWRGR